MNKKTFNKWDVIFLVSIVLTWILYIATIFVEGVVGGIIRTVMTAVCLIFYIRFLAVRGKLNSNIFWFFIVLPCSLIAVWILLGLSLEYFK